MRDEKARRFFSFSEQNIKAILQGFGHNTWHLRAKISVLGENQPFFAEIPLFSRLVKMMRSSCYAHTKVHPYELFVCNRKFTFYPLLFHKRGVHYIKSKDID